MFRHCFMTFMGIAALLRISIVKDFGDILEMNSHRVENGYLTMSYPSRSAFRASN